ncbi:hypothetical protein [Taibaiella sp. KBW10]|uniref:hypothetical protein n=1 Tax=Taibaiella sp. KBW10 TaxID=2153357 RepID=UPI000F58F641|nr:hypothetical protein [Taibaiella sp. KBW10]
MKNIQFDNTILGEPEIKFTVDKENFINLWIGSFDELMELGKPMANGKWDNFLLHYHMNDGFYNEPNWVIPSIQDYLNSITNIPIPDNTDNSEVKMVKDKLIDLFTSALMSNSEIKISYF